MESRHGRGTAVWALGRYEGDWRNGQPHGKGGRDVAGRHALRR